MIDEAANDFYFWCEYYREIAMQDTTEKPIWQIESELRSHVIMLKPVLEKMITRLIEKQIDPCKCVAMLGELYVIAMRQISYLMGSIEPKLDDVWALAKQLELSPKNPKVALKELILEELRSKPALSAMFDRLSFLTWETIDEQDSKNINRLGEILLTHNFEIEKPRGEKKARLKAILDNVVQ